MQLSAAVSIHSEWEIWIEPWKQMEVVVLANPLLHVTRICFVHYIQSDPFQDVFEWNEIERNREEGPSYLYTRNDLSNLQIDVTDYIALLVKLRSFESDAWLASCNLINFQVNECRKNSSNRSTVILMHVTICRAVRLMRFDE